MRLRKEIGKTDLWLSYYIETWNLGVASTSVWSWESLGIGKIDVCQGKPEVKLWCLLWLWQSPVELPW